MTGKETLKLRDRVRYNLVNREDKQAVDIAFDALEEMENLRAADACPLTADDLCAMVKQNGGKPVVVFVYCFDKDGTLALDCGEWEMFDGRDFVCAGVEDDLRGYGERFVAYKEPLPEKETAAADACPLTGCGGGEAE